MKKRFSIRYKLILIFGFLIVTALTIESVLAVHTARKVLKRICWIRRMIQPKYWTAELSSGFNCLKVLPRCRHYKVPNYRILKRQYC